MAENDELDRAVRMVGGLQLTPEEFAAHQARREEARRLALRKLRQAMADAWDPHPRREEVTEVTIRPAGCLVKPQTIIVSASPVELDTTELRSPTGADRLRHMADTGLPARLVRGNEQEGD